MRAHRCWDDGFYPYVPVQELGDDQVVIEELVRVGVFSRYERDGVHGVLVLFDGESVILKRTA